MIWPRWRSRRTTVTSSSPPVRQDDQAYAQKGWGYGMSKLGAAFTRLRTQDGRHLFTLKRPTDDELACLEFETEVADRDQIHEAIQHMGFCPTVRIVKTRRTARLAELSLCLDEVEHIGAFYEIGKVVGPGQSGEAGRCHAWVDLRRAGGRSGHPQPRALGTLLGEVHRSRPIEPARGSRTHRCREGVSLNQFVAPTLARHLGGVDARTS
jgi:hypothetical protein